MSSYSSFWRVEFRRVSSCSTDRRESCFGRRGLILTGGFTCTERCHPAGDLQRRQRPFPAQAMNAQGRIESPSSVLDRDKKEVWTLSTLSTSDRSVQPPDSPGFRMFPALPSVSKALNPVRVPPWARHTPSSEGVFAFNVVTDVVVSPSDSGSRLRPGRREGLFGCMGSGVCFLADGRSAGFEIGVCGSSFLMLSGWSWVANTYSCFRATLTT